MRIIAILCCISLCFGGVSFGSTVDYIGSTVDRVLTAYDMVKGLVGLPNAQRLDTSTIPPSTTISNPDFNPNDTVPIAQYLKAVQSSWNGYIGLEYSDPLYDLTPLEIFTNVSSKMYYIHITGKGTLRYNHNGYIIGDVVEFEAVMPCVRYDYDGNTYYMLDPGTGTAYTPFSDKVSPIPFYDRVKQERVYLSNTVIQDGDVYYGIPSNNINGIGGVIVTSNADSVLIKEAMFNCYVSETDMSVKDHLERRNILPTVYNILGFVKGTHNNV